MRDARRFNARTIGRSRRMFFSLAAVIVAGALVAAVFGLAFGASTASARSTIFIPYWNTAMFHNVPHFDDGCECYSGYDSVFDGFDRDFGLFPPDNVLRLSPPLPLGPKGVQVTGIGFATFGSTHIRELHEFQVGSTGTTAKLMGTVKAPTGANGATVTTHSSSGTADTQVVTWSKNGVPVGSPVSVNIAYYIDFAAQEKNVCSSGLLSPPIAVVPTLMNSDGTTSAGRPILESCAFKATHKITFTK